MSCTPLPPIYIFPRRSSENPQLVKDAYFVVGAVSNIQISDFRRSFDKIYKSEDNFRIVFQQEITRELNNGVEPAPSRYYLELPKIQIGSFVKTPPGPSLQNSREYYGETEYCSITMGYVVKDAEGDVILSGEVTVTNATKEFLHPYQSKLTHAVQDLQTQLSKYLRGRMPRENVRNFDNIKR